MPLTLSNLQQQLPPIPDEDLLSEIQKAVAGWQRSIIALDDDPTGTQTVHDVPVLTEWTTEVIAQELASATPVFYILTNSRSLPTQQAKTLAATIGENLKEASRQTGREYLVISRSDSTLRGHYPDEVDALLESLGQTEAPRIIIPAFFEGGRYTVQDTHYVQEGDTLIPAGETPFAQDASFGYTASDLKAWVAEKTQGTVKASDVVSYSIDRLRTQSADDIARELQTLPEASTCIVNAAVRYDLEKFALGLLRSQRSVLCRTAASFVAVVAGLPSRSLLEASEVVSESPNGGLTVVGSYVPKSTTQLHHLLEYGPARGIELPVAPVLDNAQREQLVGKIADEINASLSEAQDVVLYTSRQLIRGEDQAESLRIGNQVSQCLTDIVSRLTAQPRYFIAKGGITSSDLATDALELKRALILGQLLPGVPVWKLGPESKYPGMAFVVFPGNVGEANALTQIVDMLSRRSHA